MPARMARILAGVAKPTLEEFFGSAGLSTNDMWLPSRSKGVRAVVILLGALALAPLASARPTMVAEPAEVEVAPAGEALIELEIGGADDDGGVYDILVDQGDLRITYPAGGPPQGITYLPGREHAQTFVARVAAPENSSAGPRNVTFFLIERPPVAGAPQRADAPLVVRVVAPASEEAQPSDASNLRPPDAVDDGPTPRPRFPVRALAVGGAVGVAIGAPIYLWRRGWLGGLLYWRVQGDKLLDHPVRAAIVDAARRSPGVTLAQVQRELGLSDGQLDHHVRRLVRARLLVKVERDGARHLFLPGDRVALPAPLAQGVRDALAEGGALTAAEVAQRVGTSPQHARYYLEKMVRDAEAVAVEDGGRRAYRRLKP